MRVLEFTLVSIHSLDLVDVMTLSKVSKELWKAMRCLTEMHCNQAVNDHALSNMIIFFSEMKLLTIDSSLFDWSMIRRIFDDQQISLLRLSSLNIMEPPPKRSIIAPSDSSYHANNISKCNHFNSRWSHIRSLDFHDCQSTGEALEEIIGGCQNILKLYLHGCIFVKDRHISQILSELQLLETLEFSQVLGIQRLVLNENLQRSLKVLKITKCSFLRDISISSPFNSSLGQSLQSLIFCDFSSTSVDSLCLERIVSNSPQLENLIAEECSSIVGLLTIMSQSLLRISLQQSCNMTRLHIECSNLYHLDIHGCLSLRKLSVSSLCLRTLDLAMLTQISTLEMTCPYVKTINFSGCRKLRDAKVSSRSPFSESFPRKYYHDNYIEEKKCYKNDLDFLHFECLQLKVMNETDPTKEQHQQTHFTKVRRSKFFRRSSSI